MKFLPHLAIAALLFTAIYQQFILGGLHTEIAEKKARDTISPSQHGQKISALPPEETGDEMADPACRENALSSLRNDLPAQPASPAGEAKIKACYQVLAGGAALAGYEETARWIAQSKLIAAEKIAFAHHLAEIPNSKETAHWMEWMAENLPPSRSIQGTRLQNGRLLDPPRLRRRRRVALCHPRHRGAPRLHHGLRRSCGLV